MVQVQDTSHLQGPARKERFLPRLPKGYVCQTRRGLLGRAEPPWSCVFNQACVRWHWQVPLRRCSVTPLSSTLPQLLHDCLPRTTETATITQKC